MHVIRARNINDALPQAVKALLDNGIPSGSRAGEVIVYPEPVTTVYSRPTERVLFYPKRDANPFLHFFEGIWLIAGRNDVKFLTRFAKNYAQYSDDGVMLRGAYGNRWREHWGFDQIPRIIRLLRKEPNSRRAVLQMWDPEWDLRDEEKSLKDVPCNMSVVFNNCSGRLNMTVFCRSNDLVLGAMGTNVVCLSMLQEYMAAMIGWEVGTYYQVSVNLHAYLDTFDKVRECVAPDNPYIDGEFKLYPMITVPETWNRDMALFLEDPTTNGCADPFWAHVAKPLWWAHVAYSKRSDPDRFAKAREILAQCRADDWRIVALEWIDRRALRFTNTY